MIDLSDQDCPVGCLNVLEDYFWGKCIKLSSIPNPSENMINTDALEEILRNRIVNHITALGYQPLIDPSLSYPCGFRKKSDGDE